MLALSDIKANSFYCLSYLLFKHGTLVNRRQRIVINHFIYRFVFVYCVKLIEFFAYAYTGSETFKGYFILFIFAFITPFQYFFEGITYRDFGYDVYRRIFGEYQRNFEVNIFSL